MYDTLQVENVYDSLTAKIKTDLDNQFTLGRLKGSDYASAYSKLMDECLQLAFKAPVKEQQITSMQKDDTRKDNITNKELALKDAEIATQQRQRQGFDDNMKLKLFEAQMNSWSMMFSSGMLDTSPSIITNDEVTTLYNNLKTELGL